MPEPTINLLNISKEQFKQGFMDVLNQHISLHSNNPSRKYHLIRYPDYVNLENMIHTNLDKFNMNCTSIYSYWKHVNDFDGNDLLFNYQHIIDIILDYLECPEARLIENLDSIKYSFSQIIQLCMSHFTYFIIQYSPHQLGSL
jgi:hypothetical protein